jgi:adenylylsulfate kinase-like enzyme
MARWKFAQSAFKHGFDEKDFYEVLVSRPLKLRSRRGLQGIYELYGRNFAGTHLFIVYRRQGQDYVVFHMSRMTQREKKFYRRYRP